MRIEPAEKRTIAFIDGQNLFHAAKQVFSYKHPNYDPALLAQGVCTTKGWNLCDTYFYTGIPDKDDNPFWNHYWSAKLAVMGTREVKTYSRPLKYRSKTITLPDGNTIIARVGQEKGIDIRLALDVVRLALENQYDVALIFSQDQDLSEVAEEVRKISLQQDRWIKVACAFPISSSCKNRQGIYKTDWIPVDQALYDACCDPREYRMKRSGTSTT